MCKILKIIGVFLFVAGCGEKTPLSKLTLTYVKSPLNTPAIIAYKKNMFADGFKEKNITVNYAEINSGAQQTEAMAAGSVDFATVLGGTSAILAAANGADIKVIGMFGRAPKAYMLQTKNPTVRSIKDLKGKKIGGPKGTILHQLLIAGLQKENMTLNDIEFISMGIPEALNSMLSGDIDAALLGGAATLAAEKQGAREIMNGEDLLEGSTVIAARGDIVRKHPDIIQKFLEIHRESIDFMQQNMPEAISLTAEEVGLSEDEVISMLPWYNFDPEIKESDIKDLEATQQFLIDSGLLEKSIPIINLIAR